MAMPYFNPSVPESDAILDLFYELKNEWMAEGGGFTNSRSEQDFLDQAVMIYENRRSEYLNTQSPEDAREDYLCSFE